MAKRRRIFVFGSNELGIHGGGAARAARVKHGAILHQGFGLQGESFGIPTCSKPTGEPDHEITYEKLQQYVRLFLEFAREHTEWDFEVTQVGCGLAGWTAEQVAPLFADAPSNCEFDTAWEPWLGEECRTGRKYWGHVA
jgi:hypothetical protein